MNRTVLILLLVAAIVLPQAACASDPNQNELQALTQRCAELSKQHGYNYQMLSGKVIHSSVNEPPIDCFWKECLDQKAKEPPQKRNTVNSFRPFTSDSNDRDLVVLTPLEDEKELMKKGRYMQADNHYAFCARELENKNPITGEASFQIDDVSTIKQLNNNSGSTSSAGSSSQQ